MPYRRESIIEMKFLQLGNLLAVVALLVSVFSQSTTKFPLVILPLFYAIFYIGIIGLPRYLTSPALLIINVLYALRYFVMPILIFLSPDTDYAAQYISGTWLLVYEEIIVAFYYFYAFNLKKVNYANSQQEVVKLKSGNLYFATTVLALFSLILIMVEPSALSKYNFVFSVSADILDMTNLIDSSLSTMGSFAMRLTILLIPATICIFFAEKYNNTKRNKYFYLAFILPLFLSLSVIEGSDRGTVLLQGIAVVYLSMHLMPDKVRIIRRFSIVLLVILGVFFVFIRLFQEVEVIGVSNIVTYIQSYVAGIKNMDVLVKTKSAYGSSVNLKTVFYDITANIPLLSHLSDITKTCGYFYNIAYGRPLHVVDQVMPLFGNGLMYFGYIIAPVFNILSVKFVLWLDKRYLYARDSFEIYLTSYAASMMAFSHYQNLQLIFLYLTCRVLPLFFVYIFVRRINFRVRRN